MSVRSQMIASVLVHKYASALMTYSSNLGCTCVPVDWQPQKLDFFLSKQLVTALWQVPSIAFQTLLLNSDAGTHTLSVGKWDETMDTIICH